MTKQEQQDQLKQESEKYINEIKTRIEREDNMKYYCEYKFDKGVTIQTASALELERRCSFEKKETPQGA